MLRQYRPPRFRYETLAGRTVSIGTIPVGTITRVTVYTGERPRKVRVVAWLPRKIGAGRTDENGRYQSTYCATGGHLALVENLANGRMEPLAEQFLHAALDTL